MRTVATIVSVCVIACSQPLAAAAEIPAGLADRVSFFAATLSELLSDTRAFTARAELQLPDATAAEAIPFGVAMLDGKMRWQLNLDQVTGSSLPAEVLATLKQAQLDRVVVVLESEKPMQFGFPGLKAWLEMPMPKAGPIQEKAGAKIRRLNKVLVGHETVDGHPCQKYKLTLPPEMGHGEEAFVWTATDLKDLPIKLQVKMQNDVYTLTFRNVHQLRPDPRLFVAPADYSRHTSFESVLQTAMLKSLGASGGNKSPGASALDLGRLLTPAAE